MQMWGFLCQLNHMRSHKKRSSLCPSAHPLGLVKAEVSNAQPTLSENFSECSIVSFYYVIKYLMNRRSVPHHMNDHLR